MPKFQFTIPLIVEALNPDGSIQGSPVRHELEVTGEAESMKEAIEGFESQFSHALARSSGLSMEDARAGQKAYDETVARYIAHVSKMLKAIEDQDERQPNDRSANRHALKEIGEMLQIAKVL